MAGDPQVSIIIRARDFASRVLSGTQKHLKELGISARGLAKAFAAVAASATGLAFLGKKLFDVGVAATESREKFADVFGGFAGSIEAVTTDIGRLAGLSRSAAQELVASAGFMAQSMGFTQAESAKLSAAVFKLAGDLSAFKNIPIAQALDAVTGAMAGQTRGLKELGIVIDAAEVKRRAMLATGKATVESLTQEEEATATLALILERAGAAIGELERDSHKAGGAAQKLRADFANIWEELSLRLLPTLAAVIPILDGIGQAAARNLPTLVAFVQSLTDALGVTNAVERAELAAIAQLPAEQLPGRKRGLEQELASKTAALSSLRQEAAGQRLPSLAMLAPAGSMVGAGLANATAGVATKIKDLERELAGLDLALTAINRRLATQALAAPGGGLGAPVAPGQIALGPIAPSKLDVRAPALGRQPLAGGADDLEAFLKRAASSSIGLGKAIDQIVQESFRAQIAIGDQMQQERNRHALIQDLTAALQSGNLTDAEAVIAKQLLTEATEKDTAATREAAQAHEIAAAQIITAAGQLIQGIINAGRTGGVRGILSGIFGGAGLIASLIPGVGTAAAAAIGAGGGILSTLIGGGNRPVQVEARGVERKLDELRHEMQDRLISITIGPETFRGTWEEIQYELIRSGRLRGEPRLPGA